MQRGKHVRREILTVEDGDRLEPITRRALYANMRIGTITCGVKQGVNNESIEVQGDGFNHLLRPGDAIGSARPDSIKRLMIRRTIQEHLEKEKMFAAQQQPIKVLILFFIDSVEHYRRYDEDGNAVKGKYALMEEYKKLAKAEELAKHVAKVHNGYFSIDKKGRCVDTVENNQANRDNAERAYNLIMKDKERLLSFDTELRFIFSHSALKEGWDNPNVFQICTLRDIGSERERRQTLGRGLRLCVNQNGERLRGREVNRLTVIAAENKGLPRACKQKSNGIRAFTLGLSSRTSLQPFLPATPRVSRHIWA